MLRLWNLVLLFFILGLAVSCSDTSKGQDLPKESVVVKDTVETINDSLATNQQDTTWVVVYERSFSSFYGGEKGFNYNGRRMANGEIFDMWTDVVAVKISLRKQFPFGTILRVTNLNNDKSVVVRVTDVGGLTKRRTIDLSRGAMTKLDGIHAGEIPVKIEKMVK